MTDDSLVEFIDNVCGDSRLRVEQDFGGGFVRLRSSEAERRQAAQDIRSSEDILIELLRNARDAHARHIFIALQREEARRRIVVIDDGDGIPEAMRERIFEPRVTSKLDTAHMDKWGMHGRGMALYSVSVNAQRACVAASHEGGGTSIVVETDLGKLGEKTDQSTFPRFETADNALAMRGPKTFCAQRRSSPSSIAMTARSSAAPSPKSPPPSMHSAWRRRRPLNAPSPLPTSFRLPSASPAQVIRRTLQAGALRSGSPCPPVQLAAYSTDPSSLCRR